jgi:STIP1 family protein 1
MGKGHSKSRRGVQPCDSWQRHNIMPPSESDKAAADRLRLEGNRMFQKEKYGAALERYTEALTLNPIPALLTNRAFCHKKRSDWLKVMEDSRAALKLDSDCMKGHYYLGFALREIGDLPEAIQHLTKALELARSSGDSIKDEIWRELAGAKYRAWEDESAQRTAERRALRRRLDAALEALQLSEREDCQSTALSDLLERQSCEKAALERVFVDASERDTPGEFSNAFACRLTLEPFREPATTPSGLSYERSALLNHLKSVGKFDPVTREPCSEAQVRPNLGLRSATQEYLDGHAWAWRDCV